jgi:hypothetical protein
MLCHCDVARDPVDHSPISAMTAALSYLNESVALKNPIDLTRSEDLHG